MGPHLRIVVRRRTQGRSRHRLQVAAIRVYPCVREAKTPGGKTYTNQPVEEAVSELWLFNLPAAFTGLTCGGTGSQKAGNAVQAVNKTAGDRDQKAGPNAPTSGANFVGDLIELKGSFSLKESPYASHVAAGNSVKIENLFIDWGDGSSAVPVIGKMEGGGTWSKEKTITLNGDCGRVTATRPRGLIPFVSSSFRKMTSRRPRPIFMPLWARP